MADELTKVIAKVESTHFGFEDHGIWSCNIGFDFGASVQGTGHYGLDRPVKDEDGKLLRREGTAWGLEFLIRIMKACGVGEWSRLKGRTVYVLKDGEGWDSNIVGIEPLPFERGERFVFADIDYLIPTTKSLVEPRIT